MIQEKLSILNNNSSIPWQTLLANVITDPLTLLKMLELEDHFSEKMRKVIQTFPLRVPAGFVERIKKGDINDPLLRQILPVTEELITQADYTANPVGDLAANKIPGLLHKYKGRVLLILAGICAINCRYCFRREFPYADNNPGTQGWQKAIDYIAADSSIEEVIFSGGEPLILPDKSLAKLTQELEKIPHVKTLRIHTRLPIVLPERINTEFIAWFSHGRLKPVMIIHSNHPNELDESVAKAISILRQANVTVLNQSVLLKGVNDEAAILISLSKRLFELGVMPYYLHLLDKVKGSTHFEVALSKALELQKALQTNLPGYLVPRLVKEEAGESSKTALF